MVVSGIQSNLKILMTQRGLDREQVVKDVGISSATLTKVKQGKNVYLATLVRLCQYLGVSLDELLTISLTTGKEL